MPQITIELSDEAAEVLRHAAQRCKRTPEQHAKLILLGSIKVSEYNERAHGATAEPKPNERA